MPDLHDAATCGQGKLQAIKKKEVYDLVRDKQEPPYGLQMHDVQD
jgi:hypothetical protein